MKIENCKSLKNYVWWKAVKEQIGDGSYIPLLDLVDEIKESGGVSAQMWREATKHLRKWEYGTFSLFGCLTVVVYEDGICCLYAMPYLSDGDGKPISAQEMRELDYWFQVDDDELGDMIASAESLETLRRFFVLM